MNLADSYGLPSTDPVTDWNNRNIGMDTDGRWEVGFPKWVHPAALMVAVSAWWRAADAANDEGAPEGAINQAGNEAFRDAYKTLHGCIDCALQLPANALHLDHRDDAEKAAQPRNKADLSRAANIRWSFWRYLLELTKCDVVCGACHDVRTVARAQGITRDEAREVIEAARRATVLGALRAGGVNVDWLTARGMNTE